MVKKRRRSRTKSPPESQRFVRKENGEIQERFFFLDENESLLEDEEPQSNVGLIRFILIFTVCAGLLLGFLIFMNKLWERP